MAEKKWDLSDRRVELPDGSTFEFAWDMDVYPVPREQIEEHGIPRYLLEDTVDDVIALAKMLEAWGDLHTSELTTEIGILWELHRRIDNILHAYTVTGETSDVPLTGGQMALDNIARVKRTGHRMREFCDLDPVKVDVSKGIGALAALLGGLGD